MTEAALRAKIIKRLRGYSGWWIVTHGAGYQTGGLPDIMGVVHGQFYGFEVKLPGKEHTLTERQAHRLAQINKAGGRAAMVTSADQALNLVFSAP